MLLVVEQAKVKFLQTKELIKPLRPAIFPFIIVHEQVFLVIWLATNNGRASKIWMRHDRKRMFSSANTDLDICHLSNMSSKPLLLCRKHNNWWKKNASFRNKDTISSEIKNDQDRNILTQGVFEQFLIVSSNINHDRKHLVWGRKQTEKFHKVKTNSRK